MKSWSERKSFRGAKKQGFSCLPLPLVRDLCLYFRPLARPSPSQSTRRGRLAPPPPALPLLLLLLYLAPFFILPLSSPHPLLLLSLVLPRRSSSSSSSTAVGARLPPTALLYPSCIFAVILHVQVSYRQGKAQRVEEENLRDTDKRRC